jgi:hypothetical protein
MQMRAIGWIQVLKIGVYTWAEDPNDVTVVPEAPDPSALQSCMSNPRLKETMQKAGVRSAPVVTVLNKI